MVAMIMKDKKKSGDSSGAKRGKKQYSVKCKREFKAAVVQLAKLKETSVESELNAYLRNIEDELLTLLAERKLEIESRRDSET